MIIPNFLGCQVHICKCLHVSPFVCLPVNPQGRSVFCCTLIDKPQLVSGTDRAAWNLGCCAVWFVFLNEVWTVVCILWVNGATSSGESHPRHSFKYLTFALFPSSRSIMSFLVDNREKAQRENIASTVLLACTFRQRTPWMWNPSTQGPWDTHKVVYTCSFHMTCSQRVAWDNANSSILVTFLRRFPVK